MVHEILCCYFGQAALIDYTGSGQGGWSALLHLSNFARLPLSASRAIASPLAHAVPAFLISWLEAWLVLTDFLLPLLDFFPDFLGNNPKLYLPHYEYLPDALLVLPAL